MAGNIPMGSMSTEIKLNGSQSVMTLRELKQAVIQATSAWKAQRAELSTIGKSTEAAEAKYKGLAETIKRQKDYISGLQEAQKHLQEAQKSVDRSTKEGQQEYGKYNEALQKNETRIHSAEQRLAGLIDQQSKAQKSLDYYKSGLADVQKQLKLNELVTRSYVSRLSSEGKNYEANKAKLNGYKDSIENLTKQQKIQEQELSKIASESGKSSEAYKRQLIRVNETAAAINKAKSSISGLEEQQRKINPTPWDRLKAKLSSVNSEADKTHHTFREVFMGSALGNAVSNAASNLGSALKSAYTEGMNLNLAIAKINGRFKGMGMNTRQIKALDKQIGVLKSNSDLAGDSASNLQTHMLNWSTIGFKGAMQMSKALAGVGDSSKMTGQQIDQMSAGLQRIGSTGKVTYSSLNRITKAAPTFMATLARGAGMSESKLRSLLKTGNVTQKQFQTWIAKSSKYADESFKGYGQSQAGALKAMTVARQKLEQEFTKPIFDAKTSGLQALKNIMTSKEVMSGANQLGKAVSNVIGYLDKHKGDIVAIAKNVVSLGVEVGKAVWKDFAAIIQNIGKALGIVKGNGKESGSALHTLATATDELAKNKTAVKAISDAIIAIVAIKGIGKVSGGLFSIGHGAVTAYKSVKALHDGFKGIELTKDATAGAKAWAKFGGVLSKTSDKLTGLLQSAHSAGGFKNLTTAGKIGTGLAGAGVAVDTAASIVKVIKDKVGSRKQYEDVGTAAGKGIGGAIGLWFGGPAGAAVGATIGAKVGKWGGDAVKSFTNGWESKKPPKNFWSLENLGYSAHNMWSGFTKGVTNTINWFKKNWKEVGLYFVSPLAGAINSLYKHNSNFKEWVNGLVRGFKNAWSGVAKWWNKIWKNINSNRYVKAFQKGRFFKTALEDMQSRFGTFNKWFSKKWSSTWLGVNSNRYVIAFKRGKFFSTALKDMTSRWSSFKKWLDKSWNSFWDSTQKWAKKSWNGTVKNWNGMWRSINSSWRSFKAGLGKGWRSFWRGLADFFGDIWKSIKKTALGGINGIVGVVNGGISGIDNVIHSFGGRSHAISLIPRVKLATGTLGNFTPSITQPTLALLNDGHDSPETGNKETIWDTKTGVLGVVNGTNVPVVLQPGMEVFSASQSRDLGFTHFAEGTNPLAGIGKFFGGIGSWIGQKTNQLKKWFELATKIVSHPIQALNSLMQPSLKGLNGVFTQLGQGMFDKSKDAAKKWWSVLWNMASSSLNGDGSPATGLLKAVEKYGEGHKYVWGAAGPDSFDCSGLVMYALKHAYGIDFPHFSGSQYDMTQHISKNQAKMGDLVFWGNHGDDHEGVYAGGNRYFSAESPAQGIHMNTLDSVVGKGKPLFGRVRGLSQSSNKNSVVKATSGLQKLIKDQVGNGFFKFIRKLGSLFGITGKAGMPTGDHTHWMEQAHIPRSDWAGINYIVSAESGWNPEARNPSSGTYGLGQMQGYNLHYYTKHGGQSNPIAQLKGIMDYIRDRYGSVDNAVRFRKIHNWYANGGIASAPSIFGEAGPEMAIPLIPSKSTRAWELIGKAIGILSANSHFNNQQQVNPKEQKEEHDFRQAVLLLLSEIAGKSDVAKITLTTPAGRALWEVVEPYSKQEQRAEQIRERRGLSGRFR